MGESPYKKASERIKKKKNKESIGLEGSLDNEWEYVIILKYQFV